MGPGMGMGMQMRPEMKQKMILAPRMIQSMEILQLPIMALQERIEQELQENPVLELRGIRRRMKQRRMSLSKKSRRERNEAAERPSRNWSSTSKGNEKDFDRLDAINQDWADHFNEEHRPSQQPHRRGRGPEARRRANMASRPQSLQDYLNDQLAFLDSRRTSNGSCVM